MKLQQINHYNLRLEIETKQNEVLNMVRNTTSVADIKDVKRHLNMLTAYYTLLEYRETMLAELMGSQ